MSPNARRMALTALLVLLAWLLWSTIWVAPLRILVVVFHELGHAAMAVLTGGEVEGIEVFANEGGVTRTRGGVAFLVMNGGYLGSLVAGVLLLASVKRPGRGRYVASALGVMLLLVTLLWFRPVLSFGFFYAGIAGAGLLLLGAWGAPWLVDGFVRFLGLFSALYALVDIQDDVFRHGLFGGSWYADGPIVTDAHLLAELTGIPSPVWGLGWIAAGLLTLWAARRYII